MNRILAFFFFMLFLAGFAFLMLENLQVIEPAPGTAIEPEGISIVSGPWRALPADNMYVQFGEDGSVSGFAGCNNFFGTYVATDMTIDVGPLGSTRMMCPEPVMKRETAFFQSIEAAASYRIDGTVLTLLTSDGVETSLSLDNTGTD